MVVKEPTTIIIIGIPFHACNCLQISDYCFNFLGYRQFFYLKECCEPKRLNTTILERSMMQKMS